MADLKAPHGPLTYFLDLHPDIGDFRRDAIEGLSHAQKSLSPKYFYDAAGSQLFNQITQLKEYYLPSTEHKIFTRYSDEIGAAIGEGAAVLEYGSGSSEKVDWLFDALKTTTAYVAVDISKDHLIASSSAIANANAFPVAAICADFHTPINLPQDYFSNRQQWL
ncbi:MAG: L-histidine N(alpha)-methyltransferase, partial [Pseudomonadota bacterium]